MRFLLSLSLATYFMSGMLSLANSIRRKGERDVAIFRWPALAALAVAVIANALWMVARWHDLGHPPFADLYECFVLLAWCVALVSMTLEIAGGVRFLGGLSSLAAAALLVVGLRFVGESRPLPPVLRSPFFAPHVVSYFVAYGALTVAALAAIILLVARARGKIGPGPIFHPHSDAVRADLPEKIGPGPIFSGGPVLSGLEAWVGRAGRIGFPFLTLGLVLGAFWGQAAWGDWWSWDPKEVWALITWLLVAAWFHLWRRGERGTAVLALLIVAVGAMYFTLFGVNYLPTAEQSVHTYTMP